jgi:hypothetical protein
MSWSGFTGRLTGENRRSKNRSGLKRSGSGWISLPPQRLPLTTFMSDKEPVWKALVKKHNLLEYTFHDAAAWPFGEAVFNLGYDVC